MRHGVVDERGEGWIGKAREVIEKRIATYGEGSVRMLSSSASLHSGL